jgi:hypothetical protein
VRGDHGTKGFRADEWGIAGQNHYDFRGAAQGAAGDLHGVSRTVLRLLQYGFGVQRGDHRGYFLGLVANDDDRFARLERSAGARDVLHERTASGAVQNLGQAGLQARAFSRGENHDG